MALDIGAIRLALKDALTTGVERSNLNVHHRWPDTALIAPAVVIFPADEFVDYHQAFSKGLGSIEFELRLYSHDNTAGQDLLDDMLSAGTGKVNSVVDAIESARPLGSSPLADAPWSDVRVGTVRYAGRVSAEEQSNTLFFAATVSLTVYVPRS